VLSNHTLDRIKFHSPENHLLSWLKKAKVFIESDSLGTKCLVTVSYFTKLDPQLTHLANFQEHLAIQLLLININVDTVIELALHLKTVQLEAMSNGDDYVPILPPFKLYKMQLSHGHAHHKLQQKLLASKECQRMQNFSSNSLCVWHLNSRLTHAMECFYQKEQ